MAVRRRRPRGTLTRPCVPARPGRPCSSPATSDSARSTTRRPRRSTTRIRPARWCSERSTARRSAGTGTGRMCGAARRARPRASTDQRGERAAQPPLAAARRGRHDRGRRREPRDRAARPHDHRARGERPAEPAARERRHRAVAERGLAPPPLAGERAAPVLLDVGVPAVERRRVSPPSTASPRTRAPSTAGCQYCGSPGTACATPSAAERRAAASRRGPRARASSRASGPRSTAIRRSEPRSTGAPSRVPGGGAEPVRVGRRRAARSPSARSRRDARRARPPPTARRARAADAAQRDHAAPGRRVAEPPVVALHRDAVRAPRVAEREVGPGPAVGVEERGSPAAR